MAPIISATCPHCHVKDVGFSYLAQKSFEPRRKKEWLVAFTCNRCAAGLMIEYKWNTDFGPKAPDQCNGDPRELGFAIITYYPTPMAGSRPSHVPPPLDGYFTQATEAYGNKHYDASGAMSRKVVDVSTQKLLKEDAKKFGTIKHRIDELAKRQMLTPDLKDWAHQIRLDGNDASHDEDPYTEPEAKELLGFTELYLTYVYSLPGRMTDKRSKEDG